MFYSKSVKGILKVLLLSFIFFSLISYYVASYKFGNIVEGRRGRRGIKGITGGRCGKKKGLMKIRSNAFTDDTAKKLAVAAYHSNSIPDEQIINDEYDNNRRGIGRCLNDWLNAHKSTYRPQLSNKTTRVHNHILAEAKEAAAEQREREMEEATKKKRIAEKAERLRKKKEEEEEEKKEKEEAERLRRLAIDVGARQDSISALIEPFTEGMNVKNQKKCAIDYSKSFQLSKSPYSGDTPNIFNEDEIWQCNTETNRPKIMKANIAGVRSGNGIPVGIQMKPIDKGDTDHINYGDTIKMCNKKYVIKKEGENSNEKITYGDRIKFVPKGWAPPDRGLNGWDGGSFSATVNPNIYGIINNVENVNRDDFDKYFKEYTYCTNSSNTPEITATTNTN